MDREALWAALEAERRSLADLVEALEPEQWEHPSLCTEWRVRDVAAHVAMTPRPPSLASTVAGVVRARGDLWGFGRDVAIAHAQRPTAQIVEELRRDAAARTKPVVTTLPNLLVDVLVHGQDIAVPLGLPRAVPADAGVAALERVWSMGWPFHARKRLAGLRLVATDADVTLGEGTPLEGPLGVLLLLTTGRTSAALAQLHGPGVDLVREQGRHRPS